MGWDHRKRDISLTECHKRNYNHIFQDIGGFTDFYSKPGTKETESKLEGSNYSLVPRKTEEVQRRSSNDADHGRERCYDG